jgi:hypothetical protein
MRTTALLISLALLPLAAAAETVDLGTHGTFRFTPPKGWTFSVTKAEDTGFAIMLTPPADVNARGLVNLVFVPKGEASSKEDVEEKVLSIGDQFVDDSVEKKKVLRSFSLAMGYGSYCVFTDAKQVGQPTTKDVFKIVAVGMIHFNDDVSAAVSLLADDEKGPDFEAMMKAVSGATVGPPAK